MEMEVIENNDSVKIKIDDLTFVNLLNENVWKHMKAKSGDFSAYNQAHPYLEMPIIIVRSKDAKKLLVEAAEHIQKDADDLRKKISRALKD
ncbi:MAG: hypothetical protein HZB67_02870 [Candidatus Aenigmarchaeota archaeon]|nr:hypothetical protein [Candidatus Aenigmarchaeota archaeon]